MHRTQDTYPLSHFRQRTGEHLERIRDGRVETITQNGQAAMVVMSPERYDFLVHSAERGHLWREAIRAYRAGERGVPANDAIHSLAAEFGADSPLTPEQIAKLKDEDIDFSDIPELDEEFWERASTRAVNRARPCTPTPARPPPRARATESGHGRGTPRRPDRA